MTNLELMQQALDALEYSMPSGYGPQELYEDTIEALRARLAQQNEFNPDWDAMAVMVEEQQRMAKRIEELEARLAQGEPEPVAWVEAEFWDHLNRVNCATAYKMPGSGRQPLYTSPHSAKHSADSAEGFCKPEPESIGDLYGHRMAFMLECAVLDPTGTWEAAHELLDEYREAVRREHEAAGEPYVSAFGKD